jgi:hypothetical protein
MRRRGARARAIAAVSVVSFRYLEPDPVGVVEMPPRARRCDIFAGIFAGFEVDCLTSVISVCSHFKESFECGTGT